jgi:Cys-rich four helix bundle protein (predicted Tat secretion target)
MSVQNEVDQQQALLGIRMSRRTLLAGAGAAAALAATGTAARADSHGHAGHTHSRLYPELARAATQCDASGKVCISHCLELFKTGDTKLAECAASVQEMMSICEATAEMAAYNSAHMKAVASVCKSVCADCEKQCRKHEKEHEQCRDCADACKKVMDECDRITA